MGEKRTEPRTDKQLVASTMKEGREGSMIGAAYCVQRKLVQLVHHCSRQSKDIVDVGMLFPAALQPKNFVEQIAQPGTRVVWEAGLGKDSLDLTMLIGLPVTACACRSCPGLGWAD